MIAIDTNVLLRYLLDDDIEQSSKASLIITGDDPVLITDIVLVETIWTLKGKRYNLNKEGIIAVINALFEETNLCFEDAQTVWRALSDYMAAKPVKVGKKNKAIDFPDALIVNKARYEAKRTGDKFHGVYTFDKAAQVIPGTLTP